MRIETFDKLVVVGISIAWIVAVSLMVAVITHFVLKYW